MKILSITVSNYKSLNNTNIEGLSKVNIFVGKNNTGKSSILESLILLKDCFNSAVNGVYTYNQETRKNEGPLRIRLELELSSLEKQKIIFSRWNIQDLSDSRLTEIYNSSFLSKAEVVFALGLSSSRPESHMESFSVTSEEGFFMPIVFGQTYDNNGVLSYITLSNISLSTNQLSNIVMSGQASLGLVASDRKQIFGFLGDVVFDYMTILHNYLANSFYFSPHRRSEPKSETFSDEKLASDGSNLARVVFSLRNNAENTYEKIRDFVKSALPDLGSLQSRVASKETSIKFEQKDIEFDINLHDMGSGVEQILMAAVALNTSKPEGLLLWDEIESHLHPGAQKYLLGQLIESGRQIFLTTHSSAFTSLSGLESEVSTYQISKVNSVTQSRKIDKDSIIEALHDIGISNSDFLFKDALVFVENLNDGKIIEIWSKILASSLEERNIGFVSMNGASALHSAGVLGAEVLERIAEKRTAIPCFFVIDRDERTSEEITRLSAKLGARLHVLHRREIENYFLKPNVISKFLNSKQGNDERILEIEIKDFIENSLEKYFNKFVAKRIYSKIVSSYEMFILNRDDRIYFERHLGLENSTKIISRFVKDKLKDVTRFEGLEQIISDEISLAQRDWNEGKRDFLVPGTEMLETIFSHFGVSKNKLKSGLTDMAKFFEADEIDDEIKNLISTICGLSKSLYT